MKESWSKSAEHALYSACNVCLCCAPGNQACHLDMQLVQVFHKVRRNPHREAKVKITPVMTFLNSTVMAWYGIPRLLGFPCVCSPRGLAKVFVP